LRVFGQELTARELEILVLLAARMPNPRIAQELVVSLDTVKSKSATCWASSARPTHRGRHPGPQLGLIP
jgi:FixJ family two-component response regulator